MSSSLFRRLEVRLRSLTCVPSTTLSRLRRGQMITLAGPCRPLRPGLWTLPWLHQRCQGILKALEMTTGSSHVITCHHLSPFSRFGCQRLLGSSHSPFSTLRETIWIEADRLSHSASQQADSQGDKALKEVHHLRARHS